MDYISANLCYFESKRYFHIDKNINNMGTVVFIILAIIIMFTIFNVREWRIGQATLNPQQTVNLYKGKPQLKEQFLRLAMGNTEALEVLERLGVLKLRYNHVDLNSFLDKGIVGYKITLLYRAVYSDIMKLAAATTSSSEMALLMQHIERMKYAILPDYSSANLQMTLKQFQIANKNDLLLGINSPAWKNILNWKLLLELIDMDKDFEHILFDFLIPDQIDCTTWLINYANIMKWDKASHIGELLSNDICNVAENRIYYCPTWFMAAYPTIFTWMGEDDLQKLLGIDLYNRHNDEITEIFSSMNEIVLSPVTLRLLHTAYINDLQKPKKTDADSRTRTTKRTIRTTSSIGAILPKEAFNADVSIRTIYTSAPAIPEFNNEIYRFINGVSVGLIENVPTEIYSMSLIEANMLFIAACDFKIDKEKVPLDTIMPHVCAELIEHMKREGYNWSRNDIADRLELYGTEIEKTFYPNEVYDGGGYVLWSCYF